MKRLSRWLQVLPLAGVLCASSAWLVAGSAGAVPVNLGFETDDGGAVLSDGQAIDVGSEFGNIVDISSPAGELASNLHNGPAIFDSNGSGGPDPDLQVGLGNILILQCDSVTQGSSCDDSMTGDFFDEPNDQRDSGTLIFDFILPVTLLSIDLVDINGNGATDLMLVDGQGDSRTYAVPSKWTLDVSECGGCDGYETLDLTILTPQAGEPGSTGGDATASEIGSFDSDDVVQLVVFHSGSGALDNLLLEVPEPALLPWLGLASLGLLATRRR